MPRRYLRSLDQVRFILTLAEAIDVVFLGALSPQHSVRFGGVFGMRIRPADMPEPYVRRSQSRPPYRPGGKVLLTVEDGLELS